MIRIGLAGFGAAGRAFLPAMVGHEDFQLVAVADPAIARIDDGVFAPEVRRFTDVAAMLAHGDIDAIYLGTPTDLHFEQAGLAFAAGKHVLVEKPVALGLDQTMSMVLAAEQAGVVFTVGHSHGFDMPIRAMRDILASGRLGRVRMINTWCWSDWVWRPRRPEELSSDLGGGVTFRQGSHQFDIIRVLGGGLVDSVRASVFDWDPARSVTGAHAAWLRFVDGTTATAVYNGYGGFATSELCGGVTEWGNRQADGTRGASRRDLGGSPEEELARKRARAVSAIPAAAPFQPHFGLTIVSCERGDMRQSPDGLWLYTEDGREEVKLPTDRSPRHLVLSEFADAIRGRAPCLHDGRWGLANLEICVAAHQSAQRNAEIRLVHQVAPPPVVGQDLLLRA